MAKTNSNTEGLSSEQVSFPVYLIYSPWSLNRIDSFLSKYGDVGFLRIIYDRDGNETNRTIAIISDEAYVELCKDGFNRQRDTELIITPFILKDNNFPYKGYTTSLFVPVPSDLRSDDTFVVNTVNDKIQHLSSWGIIDDDSWTVSAPLKSREKGAIRGSCFVSFKKEVPLQRRAMIRLLLTDTYWNESEKAQTIFNCFWSRARKPNREPTKTKVEVKDETEMTEEEKSEKRKKAIKHLVKQANTVPLKTNDVAQTTPTIKN